MANEALRTVVEIGAEHGAGLIEDDLVYFEKLGLYLKVIPVQAPPPASPIFIGVFRAATDDLDRAIEVTCVGLPPNPEKDATGTWVLSVLPVLVQWRGGHTCFTSSASLETETSDFDVILGPVLTRGERDVESPPDLNAYQGFLSDPLRKARLAHSPHWLECYAVRMGDGSVNATCRLDNRDWSAGQRLLKADVRTWPGSTTTLDSRRQFILLLPKGEPRPARPTFWSRLLGRS